MADTKLSAQQIRDLLNSLNADGFDDIAAKIESRLEKGERLTRSQLKQLRSIRDAQIKNQQDLLKQVNKMQAAYARLNEQQKAILKVKEQELKSLNKSISAMDELVIGHERAAKSSKKLSDAQSGLISGMRNSAAAIAHNASAIGVLDTAIRGLEALYNRWFDLQEEWTGAIGRFAQTTGQSSTELRAMREQAEGLRDRMSRLGGTISGITDSVQLLADVSMTMRRQSTEFSDEFITQFQAVASLGVGREGAAQVFRALQAGLDGGRESLGTFAVEMQDFASGIGANASQMSQEFLDSRDSLALFGEDGMDVFRRTASVANSLGFEVRRILEMARRFDTFGQASDHVNQLNAMFGTTLSSIEMMTEEDPVRRISMITDSIREQGMSWANMSRHQRMALSQALGVNETEAARLMNGESMEDIQREQEERQARQAQLAERQMQAQERIFEIIENTRTAFRGVMDVMQQIFNDVAESLSPAFSSIHDAGMGMANVLRNWVQTIVSNPRFQETVENIANWISEMPKRLEEFLPSWEQIEKGATELWPTIQQIGSVLMEIFNFAIEHPGLVAGAIGVGAILMMGAQLAPLTALIGPQGLLIAGVAALGYGFFEASRNAEQLASVTDRIAARQQAGTSTAAENFTSRAHRGQAMNVLGIGMASGLGLHSGSDANRLVDNRFWQGTAGGQALMGLIAGGAGAIGMDATELALRGTMETSRQFHDDDIRGMVETGIRRGVPSADIFNALIRQASESESTAARIRNSFGISPTEDLASALSRELGTMAPQESTTPIQTASAVETAPVTAKTTSAPAASVMQQTEVVVREIVMEGRRIGQAFFEIARR